MKTRKVVGSIAIAHHNMSSTGISRWQFSLRTALLAMVGLAVCLAIAKFQLRRVQEQSFLEASVRPIIERHVSSVGYANGTILWLRVNNINPRHPNRFDQWTVPIAMNMYTNDGAFGPYAAFDDHELRKFATEHPHVLALDLRHSAVTGDGLQHVAKLKQLKWLWLDGNQSTDTGLSHLHGLHSLQTVGLNLSSANSESVRVLRETLVNCRVVDNSNVDEPSEASQP